MRDANRAEAENIKIVNLALTNAPKYSGEDIFEYWEAIQKHLRSCKVQHQDWCDIAVRCLEGQAREYFYSMNPDAVEYTELMEVLGKRFGRSVERCLD